MLRSLVGSEMCIRDSDIVVAIQMDAGIPPLSPSPTTTPKQQQPKGAKSGGMTATSQADILVAKLLINGFATTPIEESEKTEKNGSTHDNTKSVLEGLRAKMCRCYDELVTQFTIEEALGVSKDATARRDATIKAIQDRLEQIPTTLNKSTKNGEESGGSLLLTQQHLGLSSEEHHALRTEELSLRKKLRAARRIDTAPPASLETGYANFRARGPGRYEIVEDFVEATVVPLINNSAPLQQALDSLLSLHWEDLVSTTTMTQHLAAPPPPPHVDDDDENPFTQQSHQSNNQQQQRLQLDGRDIVTLSYVEAAGAAAGSSTTATATGKAEEEEEESEQQHHQQQRQAGKFRQLSSGCFYASTEALPQNWHSDGPVLIEDVCENVTRQHYPPLLNNDMVEHLVDGSNNTTVVVGEALRTPSLAPYALNVFVPLVPVDRSNGTEFRPMSHLTVSARIEVRTAMSKYPSFNAAAFDRLIMNHHSSSSPTTMGNRKSSSGSGASSPLLSQQQSNSSSFANTITSPGGATASSGACHGGVSPAVVYQVNTSHTVAPICPVGSALIFDCLLYTSDAADEEDSVDLGGRRIIKKKKIKEK
eukprot:TRINITY_DN43568_c0_g1_i3.p1 TRINITY_DN43568_c0_g1~~TRINITY_DN43568_c0_g1_i3.p1  ORF type:complete len:648 (+),score=151.08 TRINITY_DN43568_c0_g1_i3:170-1945(+)